MPLELGQLLVRTLFYDPAFMQYNYFIGIPDGA
jgi:hypothetical protein